MKDQQIRVALAQTLMFTMDHINIPSATRRLLEVKELAMGEPREVRFDKNEVDAVVVYASFLSGQKFYTPKPTWGMETGHDPSSDKHSSPVPVDEIATLKTISLQDDVAAEVDDVYGRLARMEDRRLRDLLAFASSESGNVLRGIPTVGAFSEWSKKIRRYGGGMLDLELCPVSILINPTGHGFLVGSAMEAVDTGQVSEVLFTDGVGENEGFVTVGGGALGQMLVSQDITCLPVTTLKGTASESDVEMVIYEEVGQCLLRPQSVYRFDVQTPDNRCYSL